MADTKIFVNNLFWKYLERCGSQGVSILVSIILARLIEPSAFGIMSLIYVFTSIMTVFVDSGMGVALIQKKNADEVDFSSVFYFNVLFGIVLYLIMYALAPLIASFYDMPDMTKLLRVSSLILVISGLRNVQQAYVSRKMIFKKFFYATLGGVILSAIIAVCMAYYGFGVWALVAQSLLNIGISTLILWFVVDWRPKILFSLTRLKGLINYGWKLLASGLLEAVYNDLRVLIIGKMYSSSDLAYYNQGTQIPYGIVNNINTSIDSVFLPTVAAEQDNKEQVKRMARRAIVTSTYIIAPLMLGIVAAADIFVNLILTEKWAPAIPFMRIFCVCFLLYPINSSNLNVIKALGRSDIILKLEIAKKIIGVSAILITMWISPLAMAYGMLVCSLINLVLNTWPNRKLLNYSYFEQIRDILPNLLLSSVMAVIVYSISFLGFRMVVTLIVQILTGLIIYPLLSKIFKVGSFDYILDLLKMYVKK
jgi:O-antigen/teichoic acid export membrane protein